MYYHQCHQGQTYNKCILILIITLILRPRIHSICINDITEGYQNSICISVKECTPLGIPLYGQVICTAGNIFGSQCSYSCHTGYRLVAGSSSRTCQHDDVFSGSPATCAGGCIQYVFTKYSYCSIITSGWCVY